MKSYGKNLRVEIQEAKNTKYPEQLQASTAFLYRRNMTKEDFNKNPFNLSINNRFTVGKQVLGEASGEISVAKALSICTIVSDLVSNKNRIVDDDTDFMGQVAQTNED